MIDKTIEFKDHNLKDCKGEVLDKVLVEEEISEKINKDVSYYKLVVITKYLVSVEPDKNLILVKPNQIKKVL